MLMLPSHDDAPLLPAFEGASIWAQLEKPLPPPRYPLRREGPLRLVSDEEAQALAQRIADNASRR